MRVFHGKPRTIAILAASLLTIISGSFLTAAPSFATTPPGDNHWGGWLAPSGLGNGDPFYLNNASQFCYSYTS
jgi:hypothetical protein